MAQESETKTAEGEATKETAEAKDLFTRLAEVGEDAIQRIAEIPGLARLSDSVNSLRTRVDDLQRKVRGLDALEQRVSDLEERVDELSAAKPAPRRRRKDDAGGSGADGS
jgi:polyhydroxyalkanoate synthesis regulator phasin